MGDSRGVAVLDRLCVTEMFLYPLLSQRQRRSVGVTTATATDDDEENIWKNLPLRDGVSTSAHDMYESLYTRPCIMDILAEYYCSEQAQQQGGNCRDERSHAFVLDGLTRYTKVYDLANMLYWRYNGSTFVDATSDTIVPERSRNQFANHLSSAIILMARQLRSEPNVGESATRYCPRAEAAAKKSCDLLIARMIETYRTTFSENKNESCGVAATGTSGGLAQNAFVSSATIDRFVRYIDKNSSSRVMLNLYMNRFEFTTPAVARTLTVNYDDTNPPKRFRFNETRNEKIHEFVQCALERVSPFVATACSRDAINHYLYSIVVSKREKVQHGDASEYSSKDVTISVIDSGKTAVRKKLALSIDEDTSTCFSNPSISSRSPSSSLSVVDATEKLQNTTGKFARCYEQRFVCQVSDLTDTLARSLTPYDARRVLESHIEAKRLVLTFVNFAHTFGSHWLSRANAVDAITRVLVDCVGRQQVFERSEIGATSSSTTRMENDRCPIRLLYAPLVCRVRRSRKTGVTRRVLIDAYRETRGFLNVVNGPTDNIDREEFEDVEPANKRPKLSKVSKTGGSGGGDDEWLGSETNRLLADLRKYQRDVRFQFRDDEMANRSSRDSTTTTSSAEFSKNFVSSAKALTESSTFSDSGGGGDNIASIDAMREFLTSWTLEEFVAKNAELPCVLQDLSSEQAVTLATLYLFLLARERVRHSFFTGTRCDRRAYHHAEDSCARALERVRFVRKKRGKITSDATCPLHAAATVSSSVKSSKNNRNNDDENEEDNLFGRIARNFDTLRKTATRSYPEMYIHSYDTNCLASALAIYVNAKTSKKSERLPRDIAYAIAINVVSLFIFSRNDLDITLFFLRYVTAIRYPGQFLKSALLLQGTSDSGKSEFVSEVLRQLFSSALTGTVSNATLRHGARDEINTDLMSMMNSHVCQCDEPERINSELFKLLISSTRMKGRMFHEQQPQYLTNLAKIILTANDHISMRSDAGVITRLKYCVRMMHRFKPLHSNTYDTRLDFSDNFATPSVSYQFATKCFARGVSFAFFRLGMFLTMEHYGVTMCEYDESFYAPSDLLSRRLAESTTDDERERFDRFRLMSLCGVLSDAVDESSAAAAKRAAKNSDLSENSGNEDEETESSDDDDDGEAESRPHENVFSTFASEQLLDPVRIDDLPAAILQDAHNLHTLIDPYQLLLRTYEIEHDTSVSTTEMAMANFLRSFLGESGFNIAGSSIRDVVNKMKERLKMEYPIAYRSRDNIFSLTFKNRRHQ